MSLNPIQFGKDVIDQYGRYLQTNFRLADRELRRQLEEGLRYGPGGEQRLAKGPYVYLSRPFVQGAGIEALAAESGMDVHPALAGIFPYPTLHRHQERTFRATAAGRHVMLATGTGSGKTESFLLPILNHALHLRDRKAEPGITALLIYPMNALVNDQLERLRRLLAGSGITFGRYTGETPDVGEGPARLPVSRRYTQEELADAAARRAELPLPWEECYTRQQIRDRKPRLLLTNYAQLELLLLRDRDVELFRDAPLRHFVLDEVHTYTGALGSEVACLLRRLRTVAGKGSRDILCVGSSATVTDREGGGEADRALREFGSRLFGVEAGTVELVKEEYERFTPVAGGRYVPEPPPDPRGILTGILDSVRESVLADEVEAVPEAVVALAERLCGRPAPGEGGSLERLHRLLAGSRVTETLVQAFTQPLTLEELLPRLRAIGGRDRLDEADLQAEVLAYLTLGALARLDDEPLMRPKLHYFLQGLHGLWIEYGWDAGGPLRRLHFSEHPESGELRLPLSFCRACGQHFTLAAAHPMTAVQAGESVSGVQALEPIQGRPEVGEDDGRERFYLTDALVGGGAEDEEDHAGVERYLCTACGSLHEAPGNQCLQPRCRRRAELIPVFRFDHPVTSCPACGARGSERSPIITPIRSTEVYDVMVLAQTALASMPEPALRKLLIFADSRQDAAFQAGWMESRSLRFRIRHLAYRVLEGQPERWWYFRDLVDEVVEEATQEGILPARGQNRDPEIRRLTWLLLEEFFTATERQRRNSLEQLGLARVRYEALEGEEALAFASRWADDLGSSPKGVLDTLHLVLDALRLRHAVSHPLLQRQWMEWDREVRDGTISVAEYYRPHVVVEGPVGDRGGGHALGFRSRRGNQSGVERLVSSAFPLAKTEARSTFLSDLWAFLGAQNLLAGAQLRQRRQGSVQVIPGLGGGRQVNLDLIQFRVTGERVLCSHCGKARAVALPSGLCPEYNCQGTVQPVSRDDDHYDVVQYTRMEFVPLLAREHSAQVPQVDREEAEREFKKEGGRYNCLVATPTLELGVDIGPLEMVLMRNVPPSPANYAQRAGRAGRRHRIGVVFSYARDIQHDQYFYRDPPAMISGQVRIPGLSMRNEPLIRKHVHSAVVTELRRIPGTEEALSEAFPAYINAYFGEEPDGDEDRRRIRETPPDLAGLSRLIRDHRDRLLQVLDGTFTGQWPEEDRAVVEPDRLAAVLEACVPDLTKVVDGLFAEIRAYQRILGEFRAIEDRGEELRDDERRRQRAYTNARRRLWTRDQENYALSYLARRGYFPGYALVRDSVRAVSPEPYLEVFRPNAVAIRELTPAARLYANRQQYRIRKLDFYQIQARQPGFDPEQIIEEMVWDPARERVTSSLAGTEGGENPGQAFRSIRLVDVELDPLGAISDQQEYRFRIGYNLQATLLPEHRGGRGGTVGTVPYLRLDGAALRLVNLGPRSTRTTSPSGLGYPLCMVCGEARSPFASAAEISDFSSGHQKRCGREPEWVALHADVQSEVLQLGPFDDDAAAPNAGVALQLGLVKVLETGDQDLEMVTLRTERTRDVAVLFDPMPGGSGLLPLLAEHWGEVLLAARDILNRCDCEDACYRCLLNFRNQQYHGVLNRHVALNALADLEGGFHAEHPIPPTFVEETEDPDGPESPAEDDFVPLLRRKGFPLPEAAQYRVELGGGASMVADFAYPSRRVLVLIDGLSTRIHGNPERRRKDQLDRARAQVAGWRVVVTSAQGLKDEEMAAMLLEELAVYLEG